MKKNTKKVIQQPTEKVADIVARLSDAKKQDSNEAQVNRLIEYVKAKGFTEWRIHEIEESSTKDDRKEFNRIMKELLATNQTIYLFVDTIDRFQRSFKESVQYDSLRQEGRIELFFYRENLHIHKNSNSADIIRWDMGVMFARSYVLQLSDNVKRKFEQKRRDGEWMGKPRLGYINSTDIITEKKTIVPDPEKAHLVNELFDAFATGQYSVTTARNMIIDKGLKTADGNPPSRSVIHNILRDPFYVGFAVSHKHGKYPHQYKTLVTKETFDRCQEVLDGRNETRTKEDSKPFIFKGLLHCVNCGCALSPELKKGKYVYYSCTNAKGNCKRKYIPEKVLLSPVYRIFEAFASLPDWAHKELVGELRRVFENEKVFHGQQVSRLQAEYKRIQLRVDKLLDLLLDGSITSDEHTKKLSVLKKQQSLINMELEEHSKGDYEFHINVDRVLNLTNNMKDIFDSSEVGEKREILNYLLQNPVVEGANISYDIKKPFTVVMEFAKAAKKATPGDLFTDGCPSLLRGQDSNLRPIA